MRSTLLASLCVLTALSCPAQISSGPGICFSFNDTVGSPSSSLPLVAGGEVYFGFTAPTAAAIEQIDVQIGFVLASPMSVQVYQTVGGFLGGQIGRGVATPPGAGWIPLVLAAPVAMSAGTLYVIRLTVAAGAVQISGDLNQTIPLQYALSCGPNPTPMFPPCTSYPVLGTFGTRLRFRALPCGPTPLAVATQIGTGCPGPPAAATLGANVPPVLGTPFPFFVTTFGGGGLIELYWAFGPATAGVNLGLGGGCTAYIDLASAQALYLAGAQPLAAFQLQGIQGATTVNIPLAPALAGLTVTTQAIVYGSFNGVPTTLGTIMITNALELTLGY